MSTKKKLAVLRTLIHYKSFIIGLVILAFFAGLITYASITWPFEEAHTMWRDLEYWAEYPTTAPPAWITVFTGRKEINTNLIYYTRDMENVVRYTRGLHDVTSFTFDYDYDVFPQDVYIYFVPIINETTTQPRDIAVREIIWTKPNNLTIRIAVGRLPYASRIGFTIRAEVLAQSRVYDPYRIALLRTYSANLTDILKDVSLRYNEVLFIDDEALITERVKRPLKGVYNVTFIYQRGELESLEMRLVLIGTVHGLLGTDRNGRDLFMGIAWGTLYALSFGLLASVVSSLLVMVISAIAAWYRSFVDIFISRVNEIFMVLPFLPTVIMIMLLYGFNLWSLLGIVILFSVIGSGAIKSQRALFLQIREMSYIEAARAYGASNMRIVFVYMVPKVIPMIIPSIITSVPSFVFLEAALGILGITDPNAITWGKILNEAYRSAAPLVGAYHWIMAPSLALFLLAIAFASIGFTLDKVLNPRLRQI